MYILRLHLKVALKRHIPLHCRYLNQNMRFLISHLGQSVSVLIKTYFVMFSIIVLAEHDGWLLL